MHGSFDVNGGNSTGAGSRIVRSSIVVKVVTDRKLTCLKFVGSSGFKLFAFLICEMIDSTSAGE